MNITPMTWMQTAHSRKLDLLRPDLSEIEWFEVAKSLSRIARFNGHAVRTLNAQSYSVAQHCCLVHDNLPDEYKLAGLLHDAHEYAIGDITTPVKTALAAVADAFEPGASRAFHWALKSLTHRHDEVLFAAAGCEWPMTADCKRAVKEADIRAMMTERRDLFAGPAPEPWGEYEYFELFPETITPWKPSNAVFQFMDRLHKLTGKAYNVHKWEGQPHNEDNADEGVRP